QQADDEATQARAARVGKAWVGFRQARGANSDVGLRFGEAPSAGGAFRLGDWLLDEEDAAAAGDAREQVLRPLVNPIPAEMRKDNDGGWFTHSVLPALIYGGVAPAQTQFRKLIRPRTSGIAPVGVTITKG